MITTRRRPVTQETLTAMTSLGIPVSNELKTLAAKNAADAKVRAVRSAPAPSPARSAPARPAASAKSAAPAPAASKPPPPPMVTAAQFRARLGFTLSQFAQWRGQGLLPEHDAIAGVRKEPGFAGQGEPLWREATVAKFVAKMGRTANN